VMCPLEATFRDLIESDAEVFVVFDPRVWGVEVPQHLRRCAQVCFRLWPGSYRNLVITQHHISATLGFGTWNETCVVPWTSILTIYDGAGTVSVTGKVTPISQAKTRRPIRGRNKAPAYSHLRVVR
jgi:stringent starvation protein B